MTVAGCGVRGTEYKSPGSHGMLASISPFKEDFGPRPNYREGTQPHLTTENWIKDLLNMTPPIRA